MQIKKIISLTLACSIFSGMNFIGIKAANASVSQKYQSVGVTGFNKDLIANGNNTPSASTTDDFDGPTCESVLYDIEYRTTTDGGASYHLSHGLPDNGVINSNNLVGATYQLEDYSGNNALVLKGAETGTLTLKTPGAYKELAILSASSNGASDFSVTLNYSDGSSDTKDFTVPDWCATSSAYAIQSLGRVSRKTGDTSGDNAGANYPGLYDNLIDANPSKLVTSIKFSKKADAGNDSKTGIFAVCGIAPDGVPSAPTASDATEIKTTSFKANWESVSGVTNYMLDVSTDSDFNNILEGYNNIQVSGTTYDVIGLDSNKTYYYRVRATNNNGQSFSSNSSAVTTSKEVTTPAAVTYTLKYEAGEGGTIQGDSLQVVNEGDNGTTVTAVANAGYHFVQWSDGKASASRTDINVGSDMSVSAIFAIDSSSGSSSSSSSSNHSTSNTEEIKVNVTDGNSNNSVSQVNIERTTASDGSKKDTVNYTESKAKETIEQLTKEGKDTARIVIPDPKNEVSETTVNIPRETLSTLSSGNVNLEINTENARISLPKQTVQGLSENENKDLYFNLVPIKDAAKQQEIQANASKEAVMQVVSGNNSVQALGKPIAIETNMSGRQVDITLPLKDINIPTDSTSRQAFLNDLGIYIEHSDGTKEFVKGEIVEYSTGVYGIKFTVTKFSSFTIVKLNQQGAGSWQNSAQGWKYIVNGQPAIGWKQINEAWYLMDSTGIMETGWKQDNGIWYLLRDNGSMATGWVQLNGLWYFLEHSGAMATGWKQYNGKWYYLYSNGSMASNTEIDGYILGSDGSWIN